MNTTATTLIALLDDLSLEAELISGNWNGDEAGIEEDRAHAADELRDKIQDVKDLIAELEI